MAQTKKATAAKDTGGNKKFEDLRTRTDDQLNEQLVELKREQFNLRFQSATNQLERPARIKEVRRAIAQIKTLQSERSRASAEA
jgi:large subunit ribosomal protein L29